MGERPDWLSVGATVALCRTGAHILPGVSVVTVEKIGKRDVVLSNGERINVDCLSRSLGTWSGSLELRSLDDPIVLRGLRAQRVEKARREAEKALRYWSEEQDDAHAETAITLIRGAMGGGRP